MNPFGYENTSNQALTYAGKKDAPEGIYIYSLPEREQYEIAGIDLAKYDEATALRKEVYGDASGPAEMATAQINWAFITTRIRRSKTEADRLEGIYLTSDSTSKSAWASYELTQTNMLEENLFYLLNKQNMNV